LTLIVVVAFLPLGIEVAVEQRESAAGCDTTVDLRTPGRRDWQRSVENHRSGLRSHVAASVPGLAGAIAVR